MKERGKLLVIEGGVAAGKSTQSQLLWEKELIDKNWKAYREPGSTAFGEYVRGAVQMETYTDYKVNPYAALFAYTSARAQLLRLLVIPKLNEGRNVLLDRYWYSTWAYQGAEGVSKPIIWAVSAIATQNTKPDVVLFYKLSPEIALKRRGGKGDLDRYDLMKLNFHESVQRNYMQLKYLYPKIWNEIDASQTIEKVYEDSVCILKKKGII